MQYKPHPYQQRAFDWIIDHPRCALFLEPGLGKTVVTLSAVRKLIDLCEVRRALVVAPKKVAETTWSDEVEKWGHLQSLRVSRVLGSPAQRRRALGVEADVYVISRDNFVWLLSEYGKKLPFDMLILDELTSFKSHSSQRFKALRLVRGGIDRIVGLTGTPAPNGLPDLWAQLFCIDGGERLGRSLTRYRETYFDLYRWNNIVVRCTPKPGGEAAIRARISDICLSMLAEDYLSLPDMIEHDVEVTLPPDAMKGYAAFEREKVMEVASSEITAASAAALMGKLAQYACGAVYDDGGTAREVHTAKLDAMEEIVESCAASGESVLVFYQYRHDRERIIARLSKAKGLRVAVYEDAAQLRQWNAGELDVLLAHPASTAYGLNMQRGGHYILWYSTGWDLELYTQANARLHRQGQERPVHVYRLIASGTVDTRAALSLSAKQQTQRGLMNGLKNLITLHTSHHD